MKNLDYYLNLYSLTNLDSSKLNKKSFKNHDFIYLEGDTIKSIHIILKGKVKITYISSEGKVHLYNFASTSDILGELELSLNSNTSFASIECIQDTLTLEIPVNIIQNSCSYTYFIKKINTILAKKLLKENRTSSISGLYSVENRLCSYIYQTESNGIFKEKIDLLSELLDCSNRQIHRELKKLLQDMVLTKNKKVYKILNFEELKKRGDKYFL